MIHGTINRFFDNGGWTTGWTIKCSNKLHCSAVCIWSGGYMIQQFFYETSLWFSLICGCSPSNCIHSSGFTCNSPSSIKSLDKFVELETVGKIQIILHVNFKTEGERLKMTKFLVVINKTWYEMRRKWNHKKGSSFD